MPSQNSVDTILSKLKLDNPLASSTTINAPLPTDSFSKLSIPSTADTAFVQSITGDIVWGFYEANVAPSAFFTVVAGGSVQLDSADQINRFVFRTKDGAVNSRIAVQYFDSVGLETEFSLIDLGATPIVPVVIDDVPTIQLINATMPRATVGVLYRNLTLRLRDDNGIEMITLSSGKFSLTDPSGTPVPFAVRTVGVATSYDITLEFTPLVPGAHTLSVLTGIKDTGGQDIAPVNNIATVTVDVAPVVPVITTAPTVALVGGPLPQATEGVAYSFSLKFTDTVALDIPSLSADKITITDAASVAVPKTVVFSGTATEQTALVTLTPGAGAAGVFTVDVATGVSNSSGDSLAPVDDIATITVVAPAAAPSVAASFEANENVFALFEGQSNMVGTKNPSYTGPKPTNVFLWEEATKNFVAMDDAASTFRPSANPLLFFAIRFRAEHPTTNLYVAEVSKGATGFKSGTGEWGDGGILSTRLFAAIDGAQQAIPLPYKRWFIGQVQGEADSAGAHAAQYQNQMTEHLTKLRTLVGADLAYLPVRLNITNDVYPASNIAIVRSVHDALAVTPPGAIDVDDLVLGGDSDPTDRQHYPTSGYQAIGDRFYEYGIQVPVSLVTVRRPASTAPVVPPSAPSAPASGTTEVVDFAADGLPLYWTKTNITETYNGDRLNLSRTGGNSGWGVQYAQSPIVDLTKPVIVRFYAGVVTKNKVVGVHENGAGWLAGNGSSGLVHIITGQFRKDTSKVGSPPKALLPDDIFQVTLLAVGEDLTITVSINDIDQGAAGTYTAVGFYKAGILDEPKILLEPSHQDLELISATYTVK